MEKSKPELTHVLDSKFRVAAEKSGDPASSNHKIDANDDMEKEEATTTKFAQKPFEENKNN